MDTKALRNSLILAFVLSCIVTPFSVILSMFYFLFSGVSKNLFGLYQIVIDGDAGFTFTFEPRLLTLVLSVFVLTFIIGYVFELLKRRISHAEDKI